MTRKILPILIAGSLTLLGACGGGGSTSSQGGDPAVQGLDVSKYQAVDLPRGFPDGFPTPDDAKPVYATETDTGYAVWYVSGLTADEVYDYFHDDLGGTGWRYTYYRRRQDVSGSYQYFSLATDDGSWKGGAYIGRGGPGWDAYTDPFSFRVEVEET